MSEIAILSLGFLLAFAASRGHVGYALLLFALGLAALKGEENE